MWFIQIIKNILKYILPPPVRSFMREITGLRELTAKQSDEIRQELDGLRQLVQLLVEKSGELAAQQRNQEEKLNGLLARQLQQEAAAKELLVQQSQQEAAAKELLARQSRQEAIAKELLARQSQQEAIAKELLARQEQTVLRESTGLRQLMAERYTELTAQQQQQSERMAGVSAEITAQQRQQLGQIEKLFETIASQQQYQMETHGQQQTAIAGLAQQLTAAQQTVSTGQAGVAAKLEQAEQQRKELSEVVEQVKTQSAEGARYAAEAVWAEIFNNVISDSTWLKNKAFSPGRWAVGYQYLYAMYRVLNEARPKRILELGLGQSTRMIAQYAAAHEDIEHIVVEHDPEWISFFRNDFELSEQSRIVQLDREMAPYKEAEAVRVFKGFREMFAGQKFDFISIDAPLGGDMKQYARVDVLSILPECLSENFVIMLDDCERSGETHTLAEMARQLSECGIPYKRGRYSGKKDCVLISAEHMGFLTSM